jgi:hypothetical protein
MAVLSKGGKCPLKQIVPYDPKDLDDRLDAFKRWVKRGLPQLGIDSCISVLGASLTLTGKSGARDRVKSHRGNATGNR